MSPSPHLAPTRPRPLSPLAPASLSPAASSAWTGALLVVGGTALYSINDMAIKALSGNYALHQITLMRALVGLTVLLLILPFTPRGFSQLRTSRPLAHLGRVSIIITANMAYYVALAVMPMADAAAVSYTSPLMVTALSIFILREKVGPRRWMAILLGLVGTLLIVRPGAGVLQFAALMGLFSALLYALANLLSRVLKDSESAFTLSFYSLLGFIAVSCVMGLTTGRGTITVNDPMWQFLFRPWIWPTGQEIAWFVLMGSSVTIGGLMVTQAYRVSEAAIVAPFDYTGIPMAILWGAVIFGTLPDLTSWAGIALICGAGMYLVWREAQLGKQAAP